MQFSDVKDKESLITFIKFCIPSYFDIKTISLDTIKTMGI